MPGLYEYSLLKETHSFPFLYRTNFSEGSGNIAKRGRDPCRYLGTHPGTRYKRQLLWILQSCRGESTRLK